MAHYFVDLTRDGDAHLVTSRDFPELASWGSTVEEALENALSAVSEAVAARLLRDSEIPLWTHIVHASSTVVQLPTLMAYKISLQCALRARSWSRADLRRAMGVHRTSVDRLFDPNHASRMDQLDAAFTAIGHGAPILVSHEG